MKNPYVFDAAKIRDNLSHHILGKRGKIETVIEKLAQDGFDGLIIKNYLDLGGIQDQHVLFRPDQVRLAIGCGAQPEGQTSSSLSASDGECCEAPHG